MKVLVLNGSPKGDYSITVHTCLYLEKIFNEVEFSYLNVGQQIHSLTKDFSKAKKAIEEADLLIFSYPVYTFIAPSQLHYFISLMKKENMDLSKKVATQITTSKHFYDITAHDYVKENCFDMGLSFIEGLSQDMEDLTKEKGQKEAVEFFKHVLWSVENKVFSKVPPKKEEFVPVIVPNTKDVEKTEEGEICLLTDGNTTSPSLEAMISYFTKKSPYKVKIVNLSTYPFKGGCLGCFNCAATGKCVYKDNFDSFLRNEIQTCSSIVIAFSITDHSMGPRMKMYDDRQFCNGHRTVTMGMPMAYIISGPYSDEHNLQTIVRGRGEVGGNYIAGVATDETDPQGEIDSLIANLDYALKNKYVQSPNFLGVGGMKIFRDLIYVMRGLMKEDHRFYKAHGFYDDLPQKQKGTILKMKLVGLLMNPKLMEKAGSAMKEGMISPYKKVLDKVSKQ